MRINQRKSPLLSLLLGATLCSTSLFMACDGGGKPAELGAAWYDEKGPIEGEAASSYADIQLPPRADGAPPAITLSLWLKPLSLDRPEHEGKKKDHAQLKDVVLSATGLSNMPNPLPTTAPKTRLLSATQHQGYIEAKLQFSTPPMGTFTATLWVPDGVKAGAPGVLALHGHGEEGADFMENYGVKELLAGGMVVLAPDFRAMDCEKGENDATAGLYKKGITLMGAQIYESQALLAYLKGRPGVDPKKIGIYAHDGGSALGHLVVRVNYDLRAFVGDFRSKYSDQKCGPRHIHCETLPPLLDDADSVNHLKSLPMPHLFVNEGLDQSTGVQSAIAFLKKELG